MLVFYSFVDVVADVRIKFRGEPLGITPYENAAASFLFFCFMRLRKLMRHFYMPRQ